MSSTTLEPGKSGEIVIAPLMEEEMDRPHLFEVTVETNSPVKPVHKLYLRAIWEK